MPQEVAAQRSQAAAASERILPLPSDARHTLWIPGDYQHTNRAVDVLVHFHGDPATVRASARSAELNCVVINVTYGGLSSVYRIPFSQHRQLFTTILDEALTALRGQPDFADDIAWRRVAVSSFSAGFGAVREILKNEDDFDRIAGLCMVDSLYCGYVGEGTDAVQIGKVDPTLMKDFLRYAQAAVRGEKVMILTHCRLPTPGYASTLETADYLLDALKLTAEPNDGRPQLLAAKSESRTLSAPFQLYRRAERNGFLLYGSLGQEGADHVAHLRQLPVWLSQLPLERRELRGFRGQPVGLTRRCQGPVSAPPARKSAATSRFLAISRSKIVTRSGPRRFRNSSKKNCLPARNLRLYWAKGVMCLACVDDTP